MTSFLNNLREYIPAIFALMVAAAGWFYLFYSRAAQRLSAVEDLHLNRRRVRLRRIGGVAMILMGILFFAGFYSIGPRTPAITYLLIWLAVMLLMGIILILAFIDMRLTLKLRQDRHRRNRDE